MIWWIWGARRSPWCQSFTFAHHSDSNNPTISKYPLSKVACRGVWNLVDRSFGSSNSLSKKATFAIQRTPLLIQNQPSMKSKNVDGNVWSNMKYQFAQRIWYFLIFHLWGSTILSPYCFPIMIPSSLMLGCWKDWNSRVSTQHIPRRDPPFGSQISTPQNSVLFWRCWIFGSDFRFLEDSGSYMRWPGAKTTYWMAEMFRPVCPCFQPVSTLLE